jgi:hypothetical protein
MSRKIKRSVPGDFVALSGIKKTKPSSPCGNPSCEVTAAQVATMAGVRSIVQSPPVSCTSSPMTTGEELPSSNDVLSPVNFLSSQQMVIRWGPVSPALVLASNRMSSRSDHPRKYLSRENGAFRRKQSKPEETAQLLHELTNLANPVTGATTGVPATHNPEDSCRRSSTDFEFSGLGDCPELLAEFLDASTSSFEELNRTRSAQGSKTRAVPSTPVTHDNSPSVDRSRSIRCCLSAEFDDNPLENTECEFWSEAAYILDTQEGTTSKNAVPVDMPKRHTHTACESPSTTLSNEFTHPRVPNYTADGIIFSNSIHKSAHDSPKDSKRNKIVPSESPPDGEGSTMDEFDFLLSQANEDDLQRCESTISKGT